MKFMVKWILIVICTLVLIHELSFLNKNQKSSSFTRTESDCGRFLNDTEIVLENDTWQMLKIGRKTKLYFKNAYVDSRKKQNVTIPALGAGTSLKGKKLFCQLWIEDEVEPILREASITESSFKNLKFSCKN